MYAVDGRGSRIVTALGLQREKMTIKSDWLQQPIWPLRGWEMIIIGAPRVAMVETRGRTARAQTTQSYPSWLALTLLLDG